MKRYVLNYNTGAGCEWYNSVKEAIASCNPTLTQEPITVEIVDENAGIFTLYIARWHSKRWDPDADYNNYDDSPGLLACFGGFGYYENFVAW